MQTLSIVQEIASTLEDPDRVQMISRDLSNVNPNPVNPLVQSTWSSLSLSGYPSLLLLFSILEERKESKEGIAHRYAVKIKEAIEREGLYLLSLFGGVTGLCFTLRIASCSGTRYQKMIQVLQTHLLDRVEPEYFAPLEFSRKVRLPISPRLYDPVQGICGIGRYALENLSDPAFETLAKRCIEACITLIQPYFYKDQIVPGWFISPNDFLNQPYRSNFPKGTFNLGLAHGITGILAFLAIASLKGFIVPGQMDALRSLSSWIRQKSFLYNENPVWPQQISWEEEIEKIPPASHLRAKDAWCYGTAGIARSLFLAGTALENKELKEFALQAFRGIFSRSLEERQLISPNVCHGISGLILLSHFMSQAEGADDLKIHVKELEAVLLSSYQKTAPFGFQDIEGGQNGKYCRIDKPGYLEGTVGILLTLLSICESLPKWHLPLMVDV